MECPSGHIATTILDGLTTAVDGCTACQPGFFSKGVDIIG
jgi:hypothetical protein